MATPLAQVVSAHMPLIVVGVVVVVVAEVHVVVGVTAATIATPTGRRIGRRMESYHGFE